jgi:hypothetical protein
MKTRYSKLARFHSLLFMAAWGVASPASAQAPAGRDLHLYAGLTITGAVGSADETGSAARFFSPSAVAMDSVGNLYVLPEDLNLLMTELCPMPSRPCFDH